MNGASWLFPKVQRTAVEATCVPTMPTDKPSSEPNKPMIRTYVSTKLMVLRLVAA